MLRRSGRTCQKAAGSLTLCSELTVSPPAPPWTRWPIGVFDLCRRGIRNCSVREYNYQTFSGVIYSTPPVSSYINVPALRSEISNLKI